MIRNASTKVSSLDVESHMEHRAHVQVGAEFLARHYPGPKLIFLPDPTWANHNKIFPAGGIEIRKYRYYLPKTRGLDYEVWLSASALSLI